MSDILITPDELVDLSARDERVRILDVRWRLDRPDGRPEYLDGHIPGAVYVDLEAELAGRGAPAEGRHPLPDTPSLERAARRWGLDDGDTVVVYDDLKSFSASRAWWLLKDAGVEDVRVLDGALRGWVAAGHALEQGDVVPAPGSIVLSAGRLPQLTIDAAAAVAQEGVLIDVRAPERYRGDVEPIDPRAGHVPGARNLFTGESVDARGRFLPPDELRARFEEVGARVDRPVGVYCGSGVTASHAVVALTLAGFSPRLYPGSWSAWSNTERPVATGASRFGEAHAGPLA
ncbi:sulfurtransferase [Microbacterium betulae]|uniref:Sulfurtransferase n=1 Tax=Microbacterium betulae TaxID=2981139 RepID=A0AA97I6M3_9MICO|nr:sulfurtransferase [Microbacterium sp. AB]WOF23999.1 sulfurtransferase [Microbacterium sp. AB]